MYYNLLTNLVDMVKVYEEENCTSENVQDFGHWLVERNVDPATATIEPTWLGKAAGRSADSVINTSLVHLYRYAKLQAKTAIVGTAFSTPDDFIYLIGLTSLGSMTKTALIKLNVHEKSAGIQIINRLIDHGFAEQRQSDDDKRSRMIHITNKGKNELNSAMLQIKKATNNVTEPLSHHEKMDLIRIMTKLENFHEQKALEN